MKKQFGEMIRKRFYEEHPFKSGREGMRHFGQIVRYLDEVTNKELLEYIEQVEKLLIHAKRCHSCTAKLVVFLKIMTKRVDPDRNKKYNKMLQSYQRRVTGRNYEQEVLDAIESESGDRPSIGA